MAFTFAVYKAWDTEPNFFLKSQLDKSQYTHAAFSKENKLLNANCSYQLKIVDGKFGKVKGLPVHQRGELERGSCCYIYTEPPLFLKWLALRNEPGKNSRYAWPFRSINSMLAIYM